MKLADAMVQSGFLKIVLKTDNEPAILELKRAATCLAREETAIEVVPEGVKRVRQSDRRLRTGGAGGRAQGVDIEVSVEELHGVTLLPIPSSSCLGSGIREPDHESPAQAPWCRANSLRASSWKAVQEIAAAFRRKGEIFVGLVERSDIVIVTDPRNGVQSRDFRKVKGRMAT